MKIVAVDPRRVGIAAQADVLLQVRPGTDGALALALIDVAIKEKLYRRRVRAPMDKRRFLVRTDTGAALTEADLTASGSPQRFVAWDEIADAPVIYDARPEALKPVGPTCTVSGARGYRNERWKEIVCEPAFARLAALAADYAPETLSTITGCPRKSQAGGASAGGESAGQHVHAQRRGSAHQCDADQPGDRNVLRAVRRLRPAGRQCSFP